MSVTSVKVEDRLDGVSNFLPWKARISVILKEQDLWEVVTNPPPAPAQTSGGTPTVVDPTVQAAWDKKDIKAQRVILEAIKDHLILHVAEKTRSKEMLDALVSLFQSDNMSRKMILKTKLRECRMSTSDNVTSYLMRITQIRDQLAVVGETVLDAELVNVALNGFSKAWEPFIMGICAREKLPKWERLWDDCIQEETRRESRSGKQGGGATDDNLALVSKTKKGKGKVVKKVDSQGEGQQSGQKRDMSKIKCYICHKNGHFASQCPQRKKGKGKPQTVAATAETQLSELACKFENDCAFVSCLSTNTTPKSAWYLDSGASRHMTEARELFNSFSEDDSDLHIELGNEAKYAVRGQGTVQFQLSQEGPLMHRRYSMYLA
jgi:hypothetical protein